MSRSQNSLKDKLKEELAEYFEAPAPERKREFVRQLGVQKISLTRMVFMQAKYISPRVWIWSFLMFGLAVGIATGVEAGFLSAVYACVPFLVTLSVMEITRSYRHGMEELEMSARFSLKSIVLARMVMLGLGNLAVLTAMVPVLGGLVQGSGIYLYTPYFLTAGGCLCIVRLLRGSESVFLCFGWATLLSGLIVYLPWQFADLLSPRYSFMWVLLCGFGIFFTVRESYRNIRMAESCGS